MSNLDNFFNSCPGLMSDGRGSVKTDYRPKNDTFKASIGTASNSYQYREKLQKSGFSDIDNTTKYNTCGVVPLGDIKYNKEIVLNYDTTGNYLDAFKPLINKPSTTVFSNTTLPKSDVRANNVEEQVTRTTSAVTMPKTVPLEKQAEVNQPTLPIPVYTTSAVTMPNTFPLEKQAEVNQPTLPIPVYTTSSNYPMFQNSVPTTQGISRPNQTTSSSMFVS
jgi:hypothetical protein